jgi:hypothetical protein
LVAGLSPRRPQAIAREYALEEHHLRLLIAAAEARDRAQEARALLDVEGLVYHDRFGAPRAHPAAAIERDNRMVFARPVRELGLDDEPPAEPDYAPRRNRSR